MQSLWCCDETIVFVDEKKFKKKEIEVMFDYGYRPVNEHLSLQLIIPFLFFDLKHDFFSVFDSFFFFTHFSFCSFSLKKLPQTLLPQKIEVIGTLGCVPPGPTFSGEIGNVGLLTAKYTTGCYLTMKDILL